MGKIIAVDFGEKRCGVAETDDLRIAAFALDTIPTSEFHDWLSAYLDRNKVDIIVFGRSFTLEGKDNPVQEKIEKAKRRIRNDHPALVIDEIDERFTSKMASDVILQSGIGRKKRRDKGLIDKVSATLILQDYLQQLGAG